MERRLRIYDICGLGHHVFGLIFGRKSDLTIAATAFVPLVLMIAHWNWMDPSIANLQPVLDSYWLMIHGCNRW